nr:CocE/NonD family hydrolase [Clostridia bacterium]
MTEKIIYGVSWPRISENSRSIISEDYVPMRDGVELYTIISVPKGAEKCPIVLYRTPYDHPHNGKPKDLRPFYLNNQFIERGYAVIHQHCRGTGDSLGECYPYQNEREDGLAMLDYIRTLPFYNGEIFVAGGSYLSSVHLLYLDPVPHDVKGAALDIQTDRMYFRNYRCGMNYNWSNYEWWLSMMKHRFPDPDLTQAKVRPYKDMMKRMIGEDIPRFTGTLIHDKYDEFWQNDPRTNVSEHLTIPVLLTDGWYDFYIDGMFSMWERLSDETRAKSAFVVGPWGHSTRLPKNPEYIPENGSIPSDYAAEWFDSIRENRPYKYAEVGKVNYHSIGGGKWCVGDMPKMSDDPVRYYLGGNGKLTDKPESGSLTYTYDPEVRLGCFKFHTIYKAHEVGSVDNVLSFVSDESESEQSFYGRV